MQWDNKLNEIAKRVAEKHNVELEDIKGMFDFTMMKICHCMGLSDLPKILIRGFGSFRVTASRIETKIKSLNYSLKRKYITEDEYKKEKKRFEKIIERRNKEKIRGNN